MSARSPCTRPGAPMELDCSEMARTLTLQVSLPSGRSAAVSLLPGDTVGDLKVAAQRSLGQGFLKLVADGCLLNPEESLQSAGLQDGDIISAVAQRVKITSTQRAFALWCVGGDKIVTWGDPNYGGDSTRVAAARNWKKEVHVSRVGEGGVFEEVHFSTAGEVRNFKEVHASQRSFAALTFNGSLVTWGDFNYAGIHEENVTNVYAVGGGFRVMITEGVIRKALSVGMDALAPDRVCEEFDDVMSKGHFSQTTRGTAFAAILSDGTVETWGEPKDGGDSSVVEDQLKNVQQLCATAAAFAAKLVDGTVVTWGDALYGGDSTAVQDQLRNVRQLHATTCAFAAVLDDRNVVTWGDPEGGADSAAVQDQLRNIHEIHVTNFAFTATLANGRVVTWGDPEDGGDSSAVQEQLFNVQQVHATAGAFAAIVEDGRVVTWGDPDCGGDSSAVQHQLRDVQQIQATDCAFAAILANGTVTTWGDPEKGGDNTDVYALSSYL